HNRAPIDDGLHDGFELADRPAPDLYLIAGLVLAARRDLQAAMKKEAKPWCIGKGFDHGAPIGPLFPIESTGEITAGPITLKVNGEVRQQGDIADLIWSINEVIAHVSNAWVLQAGDLIYTGTPAGVGPVARGDVMTVEATRVGGFALKVV
ncbi:MAG: fumarylacetoacetate hydrolase family protein, partial [Burkholderiaceae bacterium]